MNIDILFFAIIACYLVYRLSKIVGRIDSNYSSAASKLHVEIVENISTKRNDNGDIVFESTKDNYPAVARVIRKINEVDANFSEQYFCKGTDSVLEMFIELCNRKIKLENFVQLCSEEMKKQITSYYRNISDNTYCDLISSKCRIIDARLTGNRATIKIEYKLELIIGTYGTSSNRTIYPINICSFQRDITSSNPDWVLIEMDGLRKIRL